MQATKSCNGLPSTSHSALNKMKSHVDHSIARLIRHQQLPCYWPVDSEGGAGGVADGTEDVELDQEGVDMEEKFEMLVEANVTLLERVVSV